MPVTNYIWDVENDSYLAETDEADTTTAVYTNEPVHYGNLVSQRRGATTSYHHYDVLGSTRELTGSTEAVSDAWLYDAWGDVVVRTGSTPISLQYAGELGYYTDRDSNSLYVRDRVYGHGTGRWSSLDPLRFAVHLNRYAYAANNPVHYIDPSGGIFAPRWPKCYNDFLACRRAALDEYNECIKHEQKLRCRIRYLKRLKQCDQGYDDCVKREKERLNKTWWGRCARWIRENPIFVPPMH